MKILVAVDGSRHSMKAASTAIRIARSTRSPLTVITVVEPPRAPLEYMEEVRLANRRQAERILRNVQARARKGRVAAKIKVAEGHVPTEIARFAEKGRFDLLVAGSRGLSGVGKLFLGSVSSALVNRAKTSVLVVR